MKKILIGLILFHTTASFAQVGNGNIIPAPVSYKVNAGEFIFSNKTKIAVNDFAELNSLIF